LYNEFTRNDDDSIFPNGGDLLIIKIRVAIFIESFGSNEMFIEPLLTGYLKKVLHCLWFGGSTMGISF